MKICVTSTGDNLDALLDPKFGRCAYFIIVDPATLEFKAVANAAEGASGGAGIQSAQLAANEGAQAVVSENVGPNAFQTLNALGLAVYTGAAGTVKEAIEQYKNNTLNKMSGPSVASHFGMGKGK